MLAPILVNTTSDVPITGKTTLREAIEAANFDPGADEITFSDNPADGLNGGTIFLTVDELSITDSITIDATMLPLGLTVDASGLDQTPTVNDGLGVSVFRIAPLPPPSSSESLIVTLAGLTITGGDAPTGGGGVSFGSISRPVLDGSLTIRQSRIVGNAGLDAGGVDIFTRGADVTLVETTISGNTSSIGGGGINAILYENATTLEPSKLTIERSTVSGNMAAEFGGGIKVRAFGSAVDVRESTISGNTSSAGMKGGGGLYAYLTQVTNPSTLTIDRGLLSGNTAQAGGGGFFAFLEGTVNKFNLFNSTLSGNHALDGQGGGAYVCAKLGGQFEARNSTISGNDALDPTDGKGGGLYISRIHDPTQPALISHLNHVTITKNRATSGGGLFSNADVKVDTFLNNTIVSENWRNATGVVPDNVGGDIENSSAYNLIGTGGGAVFPTGPGNILSDAPGLGPLALNGGPTMTHALQPGSPALNTGDPNFNPNATNPPVLFDQRGVSFPRKFGTRIDIGAYESGLAKVIDVRLDNPTGWVRGPYSFAELVAAGEQLRPIATQGVTTLSIHFSKHVRKRAAGGGVVSNITGADGNLLLALRRTVRNADGSVTNSTVAASTFTYSSTTHIATWTFNTPLADGKYAIHLKTPSATQAGIVDNSGNALDSNWNNDDSGTPDTFADDLPRDFIDGDGTPGSLNDEFRFHFALLAGDYDGDGRVERALESATGDGNGDGTVNAADATIGVNGSLLPLRGIGGADFEDDEEINAADLAIWKNGWGATPAGDVDGDGDTDGADFLLWQRVLGAQSAWYVGIAGTSAALVGDFAPRVMNVIISGSASLHAPFSFATVDGSGLQIRTVPVGGADTISIVFSENVNVSAESLIVVGMATFNLPELAAFSYNAATNTATWRYEGWALGDQYLLALSDEVTDVQGNPLDGEWINPATTTTVNAAVSEFPSGNGTPGGWFNFVMTLLPGDANLDNVVDMADYNIYVANINIPNRLFIHADFNGNGWSTLNGDAVIIVANWGLNLQQVWLRADFDGDFDVDDADLNVIGLHAGMTTGATWADGDLNGDGAVTAADLNLALAQYGLALNIVA